MDDAQSTADYYRFCSGEEEIKISNAICRGRRRSHYPNCHACQFNDDEKGLAATAAEAVDVNALSPIESVFRPHDICATVPAPLSQDVAWRIGHATAQYLRAKLRGYDRADPDARSVIVGRDMRTHSPTLQQALIEGIRAAGLDVLDLGTVDTPQIYFAVNHTRACGGIQTTGGHEPAEYNGFVICGTKAVPITVETGLASIRDLAARVPKHQTGTIAQLKERDLSQPYADFVRGFLLAKRTLPRPLKVVVDAGNGMAGKWLPVVFRGIRKLTIIPMNYKRDGQFQHDPNPVPLKNTREMRRLVRERKADLGVCFSGDASQCVFADEKGTTVPADMMITLLAKMFLGREPGANVLLDLRASRAASEEIERAGGLPVLARVGPLFMKKTMSERKAVFGGDISGRFYYRDNFFCESGLLTFAHVLNMMISTSRALSELVRPIQRYRSSGERRFPCPDTDGAVKEISDAHREADIDNLDGITVRYPDWWFNVRPNRAESLLRVTLEARTRKLVDQKLSELHSLVGYRD